MLRKVRPNFRIFRIVLTSSTLTGRARIIIVARNQASADRVIATLPKHAESAYEAVECPDASLIKEVVKTCAEIRKRTDTINVLMLSQGMLSLSGFDPTSEGIDKRIALNFYGRFKVCFLRCADVERAQPFLVRRRVDALFRESRGRGTRGKNFDGFEAWEWSAVGDG